MESAAKFCYQCGVSIVRPTSKFCAACGSPVVVPGSTLASPPEHVLSVVNDEVDVPGSTLASPPEHVLSVANDEIVVNQLEPQPSGINSQIMSPRLGFFDAIKRGFSNYVNFSGRARRAEYWWWLLFVGLLSVIPFVGWLATLVTLLPSLAVATRRLHDINRSGWWLLVFYLAPYAILALFFALIIGSIAANAISASTTTAVITILMFFAMLASYIGLICLWMVWMTRKGTSGDNQYGRDPLILSR